MGSKGFLGPERSWGEGRGSPDAQALQEQESFKKVRKPGAGVGLQKQVSH